MIHYALSCDAGHRFEGWFRNGADFETQAGRGLVSCPVCHSSKVEKALMAPAVSTSRKQEKVALAMNDQQRQAIAQLKDMFDKVRQQSDYVGERFAEEARRIHFGEADARSIYGEASAEEARALAEEGVEFVPLPSFPDDGN